MEITYVVIVTVLTMVAAEVLKVFSFSKKYLPLVNLGVGILSAVICLAAGVEPNILQAFVLCVIAAMGGGGVYDLARTKLYDTGKDDSDDQGV